MDSDVRSSSDYCKPIKCLFSDMQKYGKTERELEEEEEKKY